MRQVVRKGFTEEDIWAAVELANAHGFGALKFYFIIGLPTETDKDVAAIAELVRGAATRFEGELSINVSTFVPKAHTPFQWEPMASLEVLEARLSMLQEALGPEGIQVRSDSPSWARVQGVLARGDRQVGHVLADMAGRTSLRAWRRAMEGQTLSPNRYLGRYELDQELPWSVIKSGRGSAWLRREGERAGSAASEES
jgi:radical SAM superfamily enzyme YgiQ (UPF0313 family)